MRRQVRRAEGRPLTERGRVALLWLDENTEPGAAKNWVRLGRQTIGAWQLLSKLREHFGIERSRFGDSRGAGQVLVGLKRRGFAENDGGGAWLSAQWSITEAGRVEAKQLREEQR